MISTLRELALRRLSSMFEPREGRFVFRLRRGAGGLVRQGLSDRYTAIALIGLAGEERATAESVLGGRQPADVGRLLVGSLDRVNSLGDIALTCWATHALECPVSASAWNRIAAMAPDTMPHATVDLSWALSSLCLSETTRHAALRDRVAARLMGAFNEGAGGFPHLLGGRQLRSHVACFADQVYPILALAHYAGATGDDRALRIARRTAEHVCRLQGPQGQWWWHYDARVGSIVERYPVYSVHQHAMAPMALAALERAGGGNYSSSIERGLSWLHASPELDGGSLVDQRADVIWRKVARREPAKTSRYLQAAATRFSPGSPGLALDRIFPPGAIDFECRPYELGWLLYAWPGTAPAVAGTTPGALQSTT